MSENLSDKIARVRGMAAGGDTWDLSDNDQSALTTVLDELEHSAACLNRNCQRCHALVLIIDTESER